MFRGERKYTDITETISSEFFYILPIRNILLLANKTLNFRDVN